MQPYSREFYRTHGAGSGGSAEIIAPLVLSPLARSVIDVGCGLRIWLSVFEESGVKDVFGIDGDHVYWGPPADNLTAIHELQGLRLAGAKLIVFAWPAFWWLDLYSEFARYLYSHFNCVLKNDRLIAFSFRP